MGFRGLVATLLYDTINLYIKAAGFHQSEYSTWNVCHKKLSEENVEEAED